MSIPQVAIVGRPNVGKSSLFNWLIGQRVSIVDPTAGVTRDRISFLLDLNPGDSEELDPNRKISNRKAKKLAETDFAEEKSHFIELTDTGGIGVVDVDDLSEDVEDQIQLALQSADLVLFVVDAREGIVSLDEIVAEKLRKLTCPILLVANKADNEKDAWKAEEFHRFGWGVIPVSATHKHGRISLTEAIETTLLEHGAFDKPENPVEPVMKIAIVGHRNAGKSTFINSLTKEERVIASPIPGTTRDSIDVRFEMDGKTFIAIDTPGFQRSRGVKTDLEYYSTVRAERSIHLADVVLIFFEAAAQITKVDQQLVSLVEREYKPCIFVVNKWDLMVDQMPTERWADYLRETFPNMRHVPIAFITGQTGKNIKKLLSHAIMIFKQSHSRVSTATLNKLVQAALEQHPPPLHYHRRVKIYYATQAETSPPTILLFCNMPDAISPQYQRYLLGALRDELPFAEVPIRLIFRKRESEQASESES
ncbi:MAG: ribosome biogenesis GTPase Der [Planctomycetaceae bacterium]|nr:ribosome biogenesis GTPase Der [Planctomycetaceae bacterium]